MPPPELLLWSYSRGLFFLPDLHLPVNKTGRVEPVVALGGGLNLSAQVFFSLLGGCVWMLKGIFFWCGAAGLVKNVFVRTVFYFFKQELGNVMVVGALDCCSGTMWQIHHRVHIYNPNPHLSASLSFMPRTACRQVIRNQR